MTGTDSSAAELDAVAFASSFLASCFVDERKDYSQADMRTLPLGLAASLAPNLSVNTLSTAFLSSSGLAHRSSEVPFTPLRTELKFAHPVTA